MAFVSVPCNVVLYCENTKIGRDAVHLEGNREATLVPYFQLGMEQ